MQELRKMKDCKYHQHSTAAISPASTLKGWGKLEFVNVAATERGIRGEIILKQYKLG